MNNNNVYKNYIEELGTLMKEYAREAKGRRDAAKDPLEREYLTGYVMGYHRIISLMIQQAEGMLIPVKEVGLADIDPDEELV